jgi:hypothetical protein
MPVEPRPERSGDNSSQMGDHFKVGVIDWDPVAVVHPGKDQ